MDKRYYFISINEYNLLELFSLTKFVVSVPSDRFDDWYENAIPYDYIDELSRVVYARKYKGSNYDKLVSFVEHLQDIFEINPDIC